MSFKVLPVSFCIPLLPWSIFLLLSLLCSHHQYRLLQVEGDDREDELHISFLESSIAHTGETIPSFEGSHFLFHPIVHTADESVYKALDANEGFPPCRLVHDSMDIGSLLKGCTVPHVSVPFVGNHQRIGGKACFFQGVCQTRRYGRHG